MSAAHWPAVRTIYEQNWGRDQAISTTAALTWERWDAADPSAGNGVGRKL